MTKILIIRLAGQADRQVPWLLWDSTSKTELDSGTLADASGLSQLRSMGREARTLVLCSSTEIAFHTLELPPGSRRHLAQVVPYALEEELAQDIHELHFSWSVPAQKDAPLPVAVVARKQLELWQQWISEAGLSCSVMVPDLYMLPLAENEWSAMEIDGDIIVRHSQWRGFAIESGLFAELSALFSDELSPPQTIRTWGEVDWPHAPAALQPDPNQNKLSLAANIKASASINLLQGDFRLRQKKQTQLVVWRWPAIAAAALLAVLFIGKGVEWYQLQNEQAQLQASIEQTYRDTFPDETRVVNVRAQLNRHLEQLQTGGGSAEVLRLLQEMTPAFEANPLQITLLQYDRSRNELRLQANAPNFLTFERFQQVARESQLEIEQGQLNSRGGQIAGTLIVRSDR